MPWLRSRMAAAWYKYWEFFSFFIFFPTTWRVWVKRWFLQDCWNKEPECTFEGGGGGRNAATFLLPKKSLHAPHKGPQKKVLPGVEKLATSCLIFVFLAYCPTKMFKRRFPRMDVEKAVHFQSFLHCFCDDLTFIIADDAEQNLWTRPVGVTLECNQRSAWHKMIAPRVGTWERRLGMNHTLSKGKV